MEGGPSLVIQISGDSHKPIYSAKALGEQIRDALQRWRGTASGSTLYFVGMNSGGVSYEREGRLWRHRQDFEVFFTE